MPDWLMSLFGEYGYLVVFLGVFLNNIGFPIPGDTTLLGAGFLVENGTLSLGNIMVVGTVACFLGGTGSYWMGRTIGRKIQNKFSWLRLSPERQKQADHFLKRYGARAVFFARFVALVHPVTGLLAGIEKIPFKPFLFYNLLGSAAYAVSYALVGYFFGRSWDLLKVWMGRATLYAILVALVIILLSSLLRGPIHSLFARVFYKRKN